MSQPTIGIALAGGGARGIAHLGVLQALEEHGISPRWVSGASAGALVGALYAAGRSPKEILHIFKESSLLKLFRVGIPSAGLVDNGYIVEMFKSLIPENSFGALQRRLFISVTNFSTGSAEILHQGDLAEVVAASAAIPVLFRPREIGGQWYADGGVLNNLPIEPLREAGLFVIGVNVTPVLPISKLEGLPEAAYRTIDLVMWSNVAPRLAACDLAIEPEVTQYRFFDLGKADEIYQLGYDAALRRMPELLRRVGGPSALVIAAPRLAPPPDAPAPKLPWWKRLWSWFRRRFR
ncbi:MAG: patatin-like phospholipase family protein [Bacteroidia bacterium]|nr:patatin-like phospholipase family protein [Bacteroidia bacterium]